MSRDLELGLEFVGISYFDGQGFLFQLCSEPQALFNSMELKSASVVARHRNKTLPIFFKAKNSKSLFCDLRKGQTLARHMRRRNAMCSPPIVLRLAAARSLLPVPQNHVILREVISKEPLGPVVRKDDAKWIGLVSLDALRFDQCRGTRVGLKIDCGRPGTAGDRACRASNKVTRIGK